MRRKGKWTRIIREDMNPYIFDGVRCEACKMCFGLPTPYCPNCGAKMQDNEDADAIGNPYENTSLAFEFMVLKKILDDAPTVDAVEVVRCKDCKWWSEVDDDCGVRYGQCINPKYVISDVVFLNEDWYCADGERKENVD